MTEPRRTVTIFLGSSAELAAEQLELGDFFAQVNDLSAARGVRFRLVRWQWDGRNDPLKDYEQLVRESNLALFLYFTSGDNVMEERFDAAVEAFRTTGSPEVITWFKRLPEGGSISRELERFRDRLDTQLHHFYNTFETLDTVKLGVLMQVARDSLEEGEGQSPIEIESDHACLWGTPLVDLSDVPVYQGWRSIQDAQHRLAEIEGEYQRLRAAVIGRPEDAEAAVNLGKVAARRVELERSLQQGRRQFIDFMRGMARATAGELTERQRQAYRLAGQGRVDAAIAMLDEGEIERDRANAEEELSLADAVREKALGQLRATVSEQLQLADLLGSQTLTPGLVERIGSLLTDASSCELKYQLGHQAQIKLGIYLSEQDRTDEAIRQLSKAADDLLAQAGTFSRQEAHDACTALFYLGVCHSNRQEFNRALEKYDKVLDLLGEHLPSFCLWRAETLCAKGDVLVSLGRLNEAEGVGSDALSILEALPGAQIDLGRCLNLLGTVELGKGELSKACATFDRGIALVRAATEESRPSEVVDCLAGLLEDRGFARSEMGLCEEALRDQREALEAARELVARDAARFRYQLTRALMYAGMTEQRLGLFADAERHQREALLSYRELSGRDAQRCGERLSIALSELGKTCWLAGRPHEAEPLLRNSIELARPLQEHAFLRCGSLIVNSLSYLSGVVAELGHDDEAEGYDREALAIARRLYALQPDVHVKTLANQLYQTAAVLWSSHADEAEELYAEERRLLEARIGSGDKELVSLLALCRRAAGCFYSSRGDHERAAEELRAACGMYREQYERRSGLVHLKDYAECLADAASEYGALGDCDGQRAAYREAIRLYRAAGNEGNADKIERLLEKAEGKGV